MLTCTQMRPNLSSAPPESPVEAHGIQFLRLRLRPFGNYIPPRQRQGKGTYSPGHLDAGMHPTPGLYDALLSSPLLRPCSRACGRQRDALIAATPMTFGLPGSLHVGRCNALNGCDCEFVSPRLSRVSSPRPVACLAPFPAPFPSPFHRCTLTTLFHALLHLVLSHAGLPVSVGLDM